ncbi:DUF3624 domain-containing protein [Echinimonas agarilytica]|uniref:DUF3624 domain-containing protein n=1 Tax=Echinimonas agarilytica TaxID=1215918 RepID=UPI002557FB4B|nr:DUF3624 domain-containing protein [Echinimonas agarilytica]
MACQRCHNSPVLQKLGRCRRCFLQLVVLALIGWVGWWLLYFDSPSAVESVALLFFCIAFSALLSLHVLMWLWYRIQSSTS